MTMGEYIKELRTGNNVYGKKWTQEELGAALNPPVNRAAVNKWETGLVENIKRKHIQQRPITRKKAPDAQKRNTSSAWKS